MDERDEADGSDEAVPGASERFAQHDPSAAEIGVFHPVPAWRAVAPAPAPLDAPAWRVVDETVEPARPPAARPEVLPMPLAAVLMVTLAWTSLILALTGPAGVLAGLGSLWARKRFLELERARPGHQGARVSSWIGRVAVAGAVAGGVVSVVILSSSLLVDIT